MGRRNLEEVNSENLPGIDDWEACPERAARVERVCERTPTGRGAQAPSHV